MELKDSINNELRARNTERPRICHVAALFLPSIELNQTFLDGWLKCATSLAAVAVLKERSHRGLFTFHQLRPLSPAHPVHAT